LLAVITYPPAPVQQASYIVSTPLTLTVKDRGGTVLQAREGRYDTRGNLQTLLSAVGGGRWVTTDVAWTDSGNLRRFTSPANERGERYTVEYTYDTETDSLVTVTTDSFRLTSNVTYDARFGVGVRTVDATGNITERRVDAFGRLTDVFAPTDLGTPRATIHFQYEPGARPARAITEHKMPAGSVRTTLDTVVFIDGLKRPLQTKKTAEVAGKGIGMTVSGQFTFDVMGRIFEEGQPFFSAGSRETFVEGAPLRPTRSVYDVMGRKVRVEESDGTTTSLAYGIEAPPGSAAPQLVATVTDGMKNLRKLYRDMANRVVAVEERIDGRRPTTRYAYDPLGQLTRILDPAGNVTSMAYDLLGRRTLLHSPDAGRVDFAYDDAGNLIRKADGNLRATGKAIRYGYHFNRLELIDYPFSTDVRYVYGEPGTSADNVAGRIQEVTDEVGTEQRAYGRLGELVETRRTVRPLRPGDKPRTFTTKFELDSFGRMLSLRYPDGEVVRYTYDAGGLVTSAEGTRPASQQRPAERETYLRRMRYDEFGQRTEMVLGNGATTTYAYDPFTRRLSQMSTLVPGGRTLQALTYAYDRVGNITGITNALGAPVGNRSGAVSYTYGYDALYRLT
jgi:YD repeat-containing protein